MSSLPVPIRLHHEGDRITADWADIADTDPALPLLADRIARAGSVWRAPLPAAGGVPEPTLLIFHAGRCGSTLVSRFLSLLPRCLVMSEPEALNEVLSVGGPWPFLPAPTRREVLRRVVDALARAARPDQDRFILKLSSWCALHLPLLEEIFPTVPKLFIYRQPEEILVSLRDEPAGWMRRAGNRIQAALFLGRSPSRACFSPVAFAAEVLGKTLTQVADSVARQEAGPWLLVPYETLPWALPAHVLPWLAMTAGAAEADALARVIGTHAKDPANLRPFEPDSARKRAAVTAELAALARDRVSGSYDRLENLRLGLGAR